MLLPNPNLTQGHSTSNNEDDYSGPYQNRTSGPTPSHNQLQYSHPDGIGWNNNQPGWNHYQQTANNSRPGFPQHTGAHLTEQGQNFTGQVSNNLEAFPGQLQNYQQTFPAQLGNHSEAFPGQYGNQQSDMEVNPLLLQSISTTEPSSVLPSTSTITSSTVGAPSRAKPATRGKKRNPGQMSVADHIAAKKHHDKMEKASAKAAASLQKAAEKEANAILKKQASAKKVPRVKWTEAASIELLHFVRLVKDEHRELNRDDPGFVAFQKFFLAFPIDTDIFPLLQGSTTVKLLARYQALMGSWRKVKDQLDRSGSGGLCEALVEHTLPMSLWNQILDMHETNRAALAHGHNELDEPMEVLLNTADPTPASPLNHDSSDDGDHQVSGITPIGANQTGRHREPPLTEAELALDASTPPLEEPTNIMLAATQTPAVLAASTSALAANPAAAPVTPAVQPVTPAHGLPTTQKAPAKSTTNTGRPPVESGVPPRRRGRTEEAPKKEDPAAAGMLLLMHKGQLASEVQRQRAEETRIEDKRLAEAIRKEDRLDGEVKRKRIEEAKNETEAKKTAREDARLEMDRRDREESGRRDRLDREAADIRARDADERAATRERSDREATEKRAREADERTATRERLDREATEIRARDAEERAAAREDARYRENQEATRRWEVSQERQAAQQQAFQLAMLKMMGNMGGSNQ
ncbi:uncharacterized protein PGTG_11265 [Puccinia graminis f. sp. tritici CRL 75-36-700-3]|uniref:Uncharacterized protein n=1 Tax=Puccinia graminis f. sp. tritici (strain CRL 75-36-700-3 / race SCCL) TaxID=418459 RepID=E3KLC1_PUCGT|nr:uncharacterized protein PGTG_11265 [Puccinia graminis f. sp. tritici CRL 75-36-700-3]EFP85096.1 hypothetical protein PGTG_11265 [Puccinia graminis f. sp. tritici CRL 75-36-700-3]